jgi:hypothetical protein
MESVRIKSTVLSEMEILQNYLLETIDWNFLNSINTQNSKD